jgi:hypothetical protein
LGTTLREVNAILFLNGLPSVYHRVIQSFMDKPSFTQDQVFRQALIYDSTKSSMKSVGLAPETARHAVGDDEEGYYANDRRGRENGKSAKDRGQGNNKRASRFYKKEAGSNGHSNARSNGDSNGIITPQRLEVRSQKEEKEKRKPSRDEWLAYAKTLNGWNLTDAETAWDYYESNGWRIGGKAPVKDWQACARTCYRRAIQKPATPMGKPKVELGDNHRNSCYSPPTYKLAGFKTREAWVEAGCP